jgi:hypothetical protein
MVAAPECGPKGPSHVQFLYSGRGNLCKPKGSLLHLLVDRWAFCPAFELPGGDARGYFPDQLKWRLARFFAAPLVAVQLG